LNKKPKDLSGSEREERGHGEGVGLHDTLLQSDTVQSYGRVKEDTRTVWFDLHKNQRTCQNLSTSEREERGYGKGVRTENVNERVFMYDV
jgi:hypothetical protein